MPKISDDRRLARRSQILEAAWICFQRNGLHATTMDDIIRASDLSAGAVYSYFAGKEELIFAAVGTSLAGLQERLAPIMLARPVAPPAEFVGQVAGAVADFTRRDGYDLTKIAVLGWGEAQRNERLRAAMQGFYAAFRDRIAEAATAWKADGHLPESASGPDVAKLVLSAILGFVVQQAILGDVAPRDLARGLGDLAGRGAGDG